MIISHSWIGNTSEPPPTEMEEVAEEMGGQELSAQTVAPLTWSSKVLMHGVTLRGHMGGVLETCLPLLDIYSDLRCRSDLQRGHLKVQAQFKSCVCVFVVKEEAGSPSSRKYGCDSPAWSGSCF